MSVALPAPMPVSAALHSVARLRTEILGGLVVGLALIPEAISFSVIAGVDPRVGLFSAVTMAITISIVGGRPAMISAATGSVAPWWWRRWLVSTGWTSWWPRCSSRGYSRSCWGCSGWGG